MIDISVYYKRLLEIHRSVYEDNAANEIALAYIGLKEKARVTLSHFTALDLVMSAISYFDLFLTGTRYFGATVHSLEYLAFADVCCDLIGPDYSIVIESVNDEYDRMIAERRRSLYATLVPFVEVYRHQIMGDTPC